MRPHQVTDPSLATGPAGRPHVVIVGAGFGGLAAARGLSKVEVDVTLIDRQNHHLFQPLLYQVATAALSPADIAAPIRTIVRDQPRTHVLLDEVTGVDPDGRCLSLATGATLSYDFLVLASGARHSYFGRDEWAAHAPGIKTVDDATRVRSKILLAMERAETNRQENVSRRDEFLTFVIVGGGPTGVEMAGAVAELTRHMAAMDFRFVTPTCVQIVLVDSGPRLLAAFPADLGEAARQALETLGVKVRLNSRVTDIDDMGVTIGEARIETTTVIWAAGFQASEAAAWLDAPRDRSGRVIVEPDLSVPGRPEIFAIGDTAAVTGPEGRLVPGIAPAAKQGGAYVARTIAARVERRRLPLPFRYRGFGALATIGRQSAVIDFGWARLSGLSAWLIWSTAHLFFLVGFRNRLVVGMNWLWNYLTFNRGARLITGVTLAGGSEATSRLPIGSGAPSLSPVR